MRRLFVILAVIGLVAAGFLFQPGFGMAGAQSVQVTVNGCQVDCSDGAPYLDRETARVYVPLRFVSEALGAVVDWDAESGTATVRLEDADRSVQMAVGASVPVIDGSPGVTLDAPARLEDGRLMVPLRFISEALGFRTTWDAEKATVSIGGRDDSGSVPGGGPTSQFAFDLFGELYVPGENMFASPASVYLALAVLYNGASGETREAMTQVLQARGLDAEEFNRRCAAVREALAAPDDGVKLSIADSLWLHQQRDFDAEFLRLAREYHRAEVRTLDFLDPSAPDVVNRWISDATNGMIRDMVKEIDPMTVLLLANAIYFYGNWSAEFDPDLTKPRDFVKDDGTRVEVPMMHQQGEYLYLDGDGFRAVRLGYGENKRLGMYVFVPDRDSGLDQFLERLDAESWDRWTSAFSVREGTVGLPRFEMESAVDLKGPLSALGLGVIFDQQQADFSKMAPGGDEFYVGDARHKAVIEVDEKGTEAAAVTVIEVRVTSLAPGPEPFELIADRPFFFVIHDDETDTVLFAGAVHDPR